MLHELAAGMYNKSIAGGVITAGSDLALQAGVHMNEAGQLVIDVPTSIADAAMKAVAVGFFVWHIANRSRPTLELDKEV